MSSDQPPPRSAPPSRQERQAAALRENLRKRKEQARERRQPDPPPPSRDGLIGPRKSGDIGFAVLRGGDVVGDHSVIFAGEGERIELSHRANDRQIYAVGAVRAALWAHGQHPGLYSMRDVLGLG